MHTLKKDEKRKNPRKEPVVENTKNKKKTEEKNNKKLKKEKGKRDEGGIWKDTNWGKNQEDEGKARSKKKVPRAA